MAARLSITINGKDDFIKIYFAGFEHKPATTYGMADQHSAAGIVQPPRWFRSKFFSTRKRATALLRCLLIAGGHSSNAADIELETTAVATTSVPYIAPENFKSRQQSHSQRLAGFVIAISRGDKI
ncbi:MAG TPA: hypothetical protein VHE81_20775 [Lacipirellulaceae bacterium]|nr:hypothetical protein [Lacipirellulaceae bacterium]